MIDVLGRSDLLEPAVVQHADLVGDGEGLFLIMSHEHRRGTGGAQDLLHFVAHLGAKVRVEVGERLIEKEQRGEGARARATATRCCWPPDSSWG